MHQQLIAKQPQLRERGRVLFGKKHHTDQESSLETRRVRKELLFFLHTISKGDPTRTVTEVIKGTSNFSAEFSTDPTESHIISSMAKTLGSFGKQRRKQTQEFISSVLTSAVCHLDEATSTHKVKDPLDVSTNAIANANKQSAKLCQKLNASHFQGQGG